MRYMTHGQVTLEYFIIFAAIVGLTALALTTFDDDIKEAFEGFVMGAAEEITR